jgi:hypothetical protein
MTNRMHEGLAEDEAAVGPGGGAGSDRSIGRAAVIAGSGLLLMAALAGFGMFVVVEGLLTRGDAETAAAAVSGSEQVFRLGMVSLLLIVVLDVVIAWALQRVLSPVDHALSTLAAWCRLAYAAVFAVAIGQLVGIPRLLGDDGPLAALGTDERQGQALLRVEAFHDIWSFGLALFGVHLVLVGYLAFRSGYVPRWLGLLVLVAGVGYAFDSLAVLVSQGPPVSIGGVTFVGELLLGFWLVLRGRRITVSAR